MIFKKCGGGVGVSNNDANDANGDEFKIERNVFNDIVEDDHV
jgi:hypothetical protein